MSQIIVEQKELFKIIVQLEKARDTFSGLVCMLDGVGCLLDEDEQFIGEVEDLIVKSMMSIKSLTEAS